MKTAEKGPSLEILKEHCAKRFTGQEQPPWDAGGSLKGLTSPSLLHLHTLQNKGSPRNKRRRRFLENHKKGAGVEDCFKKRLIEFEMLRVEQIY